MSLQGKRPVDDDDDDDEEDDDYDPEADDDEDDDDEGIDLKGVVLNRVKHLRVMHSSMDSITAEYKKERIALEEKYRSKHITIIIIIIIITIIIISSKGGAL